MRHLRRAGRLRIPVSVAIELLLVARRTGWSCVEVLGAAARWFDLDSEAVLLTAAEALDTAEVPTVFDAVHLGEALARGTTLHTADERLWRTPYPTTPF